MQSVKDDSSSQTPKFKNRLRQTVSVNAPKSVRNSQHNLESMQWEIPINSMDCVMHMYVRA